MTDRIDWERLARYASGEADARERAAVDREVAQDPALRDALEAVRAGWDASVEPTQWDVDGAWARLAPRLHATAKPAVLKLEPAAVRRPGWLRASRLVPLAAAAAIVVAVGLQLRTGSDGGVSVMPFGTASTEVRTAVGEQRSFDLPDGSRVILGAASTLRVAEGYGQGAREVYLEGQAYIHVVHDAARPFVVIAGGTRTVDLGTAFEVRAYPNDGVRVVVTEGSVEVKREDEPAVPATVLQAGDIAQLTAGADAVIRRQQDVERLVGWTRGELTFDDLPLSEVSQELERWYDIDCRIDDKAIESLHFTGQVRIGESLDEVLRLIELSLSSQVRAERDGRTVIFKAGPPATPPTRRASAIRSEVGA